MLIEEFIDDSLHLVEEYWVESWGHLIANQLFHMVLYLLPKPLVAAEQQAEELAYEP